MVRSGVPLAPRVGIQFTPSSTPARMATLSPTSSRNVSSGISHAVRQKCEGTIQSNVPSRQSVATSMPMLRSGASRPGMRKPSVNGRPVARARRSVRARMDRNQSFIIATVSGVAFGSQHSGLRHQSSSRPSKS